MRIFKIRDVKTPARGTAGSAGFDFFIPNDMIWETATILPGNSINIPSGIKVRIPEGFMLQANNKSGVALNKSLIYGAQVVDSDYTGEVHLHMINVGNIPVVINRGEKILQFVLIPVSLQKIDVFDDEKEMYEGLETQRGDGGFGSTENF